VAGGQDHIKFINTDLEKFGGAKIYKIQILLLLIPHLLFYSSLGGTIQRINIKITA
jgi:hypothetical protein